MTDKKFTDNEIIKALESWVLKFDGKATELLLLCNALDLINRQKAEIERLDRLVIEKHREINRLDDYIQYAKSEAVREFAERLKEDISWHKLEMFFNGLKGTPRTNEITYECVKEYIDNLVKEMVGEE